MGGDIGEICCCCCFVVVSHIQRIGCQPEKTTLHGGQSRSWSAEQGKENKRKSLAAYKYINHFIVVTKASR